jgi:hypothetical protein
MRNLKHFYGVRIVDVKAFVGRVRKGCAGEIKSRLPWYALLCLVLLIKSSKSSTFP